MNYNRIPTIRIIDYIIDDVEGMETGRLYSAFRQLSFLNQYVEKEYNDEKKNKVFEDEKCVTIPKLEWVNNWMNSFGKEALFTDVNDWRKIAADYDYYWNLRTKEQYEKEEKDAKEGKSGRRPVGEKLNKCRKV